MIEVIETAPLNAVHDLGRLGTRCYGIGRSGAMDRVALAATQLGRLAPAQTAELELIGQACLEFHQALENLYLRAHAGKNLLRNKPLLAPWASEFLDRGKPRELAVLARDPHQRGAFPTVLRPDLLLTDDGWAMTELDSVPGGIGQYAPPSQASPEPTARR